MNKSKDVKSKNKKELPNVTGTLTKLYWYSILLVIVAFATGSTWQYLQSFMQDKPDAAAIISGAVVFAMLNVAFVAWNKVK